MTSDPVQLRNPSGARARGNWARNGRPGPPALSCEPAPACVPPAERLSDAEAGAILLDLAPAAGDRAQAEALGGRLGGLPLALHLTGCHLSSEYADIASFDAYRQALDSDPRAVRLTHADPGGPAAAGWAMVLLTQELSLDALAKHGMQQARPLLRLLSCYAPALPVPLGLLTAGPLGPLLDAPARPATHPAAGEMDLGRVLRGLGCLGLVNPAPLGAGEAAAIRRGPGGARPVLGGQEALLVHPVIVGANRACLLGPGPSDPPPLLVRQAAVTLLAAALDDLIADRPADWPAFRMLTPHLRALLAGPASSLDGGHFGVLLAAAGQTAMAYGQMGSPDVGAGLVASALDPARRRPEDATPAVLMARQQLACLLGGQGRAAEAEAIYREVLAAQLRTWPADDPGNLSLRHNLAVSVRHQGWERKAEAEAAFRDLLADERRVLGEDHPHTLATRRELALALCQEELWAEAEAAFRDLLKDEQRVLGDHDPQTLSTRYNLAQAVRLQGPERTAEAEAAFRDLLDDEERALGDDHFLTVATRQFAGGRFLATSLLNAPDLGRRVAGAMLGQAAALAGQGRPAEALAAYGQVVSRFGDGPAPALRQLVAVAVFNRGITLGKLGRTAEALAAYGQVVSRFGDDPAPALRQLVAEALLHKGTVLSELGRTAEAAAAYGQAASRFAGDPAPASRALLAVALFNQAVMLGRLERPEEALPAAEQAAGLYGGLAEAGPAPSRPAWTRPAVSWRSSGTGWRGPCWTWVPRWRTRGACRRPWPRMSCW